MMLTREQVEHIGSVLWAHKYKELAIQLEEHDAALRAELDNKRTHTVLADGEVERLKAKVEELEQQVMAAKEYLIGQQKHCLNVEAKLAALEAELVEAREQQSHSASCVLHLHRKLDEAQGKLPKDYVGQCPNLTEAYSLTRTLVEALKAVLTLETLLKQKFDHCGAMNATQLGNRDHVLRVLEQAQAALQQAEKG